MKIKDKLMFGREELEKYGPINIVAFGDSVTHGALGANEIDFETVYWNKLKQMLAKVRTYMPINVINAGIGGINAKDSVARIDSQVLCHRPDLVIVCFGLNDVNGTLEDYIDSLEIIFKKCLEADCDVVFLTPNMLNTYVAEDTEDRYMEYAAKTAEMQNSGRMDKYVYSAIDKANEMGITVCDCYSEWKELSKTCDTTLLLSNRINHPTRDMHDLFAKELFKLIMGEEFETECEIESTMYR